MPLLSTIALGTVIREFLGLLFRPLLMTITGPITRVADPISITSGRNPQAMPKLIAPNSLIDVRNYIIIAVTFLIILLLFLFLNKTKMGLSMQAISQNKELAYMNGINVRKTINITFVIGGIMLAIADSCWEAINRWYDLTPVRFMALRASPQQ